MRLSKRCLMGAMAYQGVSKAEHAHSTHVYIHIYIRGIRAHGLHAYRMSREAFLARMEGHFLIIPFLIRKFLPSEGFRTHTQSIVTQALGRCLQWTFFVNRKAWGGGLGLWGPAKVGIALVAAPPQWSPRDLQSAWNNCRMFGCLPSGCRQGGGLGGGVPRGTFTQGQPHSQTAGLALAPAVSLSS